MGYSTINSLLQVKISPDLPILDVQIPLTAANSQTFSLKTLSKRYNSALNLDVTASIREVAQTL